jgi:hypothetical protein
MTAIAADTFFLPAPRASAADCARQARLFRESPYFTELLDRIPDMVTVLNSDRQVVYANQAVLAATGVEAADALGKRPGEVFDCVHAAEMAGGCGTSPSCRYCGAAQAIGASHKGAPASEECRLAVWGESGQESLDLRVWANPFVIEGESFTFFVMADIGEEKRRGVLERLFLHDIMNTASNLHGFSRLLRDPARLPELQRTHLMQRMLALSSQIVDEIAAHRLLLEAENATLATNPRPLDALGALERVCTEYVKPESLAGRRLVLAPDSMTASFTSDPVLLGRVLGNMVKNALEASADGEVVTLRCHPEGDGVLFEVHNPAVMSERVRLQIFNRTFSTKGEGRGLGTYSIKFFTERYLSGAVSFTSEAGEGTTFRAWYPTVLAARVPTTIV